MLTDKSEISSTKNRGNGGVLSSRWIHRIRLLEPFLLLAPAFAFLTLFFFMPAVENILLSFQKVSLFQLQSTGEWVGFRNYVLFLSHPTTPLVFGNTVFITVTTVVLRIVLGLGLALLVNNKILRRWRVSGLARSLMLLPWIVSQVVAVATWRWMLHGEYGFINHLMIELGIIEDGISFLTNTSTVWGGLIVIIVWKQLPFVAITLLAGLQSIPEEIYEAARIDGATEWQLLPHITLPLLRPLITIVTIISTIWMFNNFTFIWLTTRAGPGGYTQVMATRMYTTAFEGFALGQGAAIGVIMSLVMLIFATVYYFAVYASGREAKQ